VLGSDSPIISNPIIQNCLFVAFVLYVFKFERLKVICVI
jgi:hypothetical protein